MRILINGMKMPKNCGECPLLNQYSPCWKNGGAVDFENRPNWCPLIELPPHGDLVDKDEMRAIAIALLDEVVTDQEANAIREMWSRLGKMTVFIPAEEGE